MDYIVETFEHNGNTVEIWQDTDAPNPFKEFDEYTDFVSFLNRYDLTTDKKFDSPQDFLRFVKREKVVCFTPIYAYIHGDITIKAGESNPFSCQWDSGFAGFAYVTRKSVEDLMGWKVITKKRREEISKYMFSDVENYDSYLQGNVYGYTVKDANDEVIDSCGGYYGDIKYIKDELGVKE